MFTYKVLLYPEPEGGYTVSIPSLPGCISCGETIDEALLMIKEAAELYLEEIVARKEQILDDSNTFEYSLQLHAV